MKTHPSSLRIGSGQAFCLHPSSLSILSRSPGETRRWGKRLGALVGAGEIVGLVGELGSGKSCFVRGLAEGLDVAPEAWIRSPSFTLINEYHGRLPIYHIDLYRVAGEGELEELNLREYLFSDGVSVVEWFDHLPAGEVREYLRIGFAYADGGNRRLAFTPYGERYAGIVESLRVP